MNYDPIIVKVSGGKTTAIVSQADPSLTVNSFAIVNVTGQNNIIATASSDTLRIQNGTGILLQTNSTTKTLTITASGGSAFDQFARDTANGAFEQANSAALRANTLVTDNVPETTTNLYFTAARVRANISNTTPINYNSTTGVISHADSGIVSKTYGNNTLIPQITVDAQGHVTSITNVAITGLPVSTANGQLLIGNTVSGSFDVNTLTQGTGITITNGQGTITIAATGVDQFARDTANSALNSASVVSNALSNEISNRISADNALSNAISTLEARVSTISSGGTVSVTSTELSTVSATAAAGINTVSNALSNEISNRISADAVLSQAVSVLSQQVSVHSQQISVLSVGINTVSNALSALEVRVSALSSLGAGTGSVTSNELSAVSATAAAGINTVSNALSNEISNRISADNVLSNAISVLSQGLSVISNALSNEISNRLSHVNVVSQAVSVVSNALSNEISNRISADNVLSNAISVLSQGLSVVSNALSNEISNRLSHVNVVSQAVSVLSQQVSVLSQQVSVLSVGINTVSNALSNEISNRLSHVNVVSQAVSVLSQQISVLSVGINTVSNALSNEISNRISAFNAVYANSNTAIYTAAQIRANISNNYPIYYNSSTGVISFVPATSNGQLLIGNTVSGGYDVNTITPGAGILVTNDKGSITIAATGGTTTDQFARDKANGAFSKANNVANSVSGVVTMHRTGDGVWAVYDENRNLIDTSSSTTDGFQEAINYACNNAFDLHVYGGGIKPGGTPTDIAVIQCDTAITFPPMQNKTIRIGACTVNFANTVTANGVAFDSCMMVDLDWNGQIVYQGANSAVLFKPTNPVPYDLVTVVVDSKFKFNHIALIGGTNPACMTLDGTNAAILDCGFEGFEFNGTGVVGTKGVVLTNPNHGIISNKFKIQRVHLCKDAAYRLGTSTANGTQIYANMIESSIYGATGGANVGIDVYGRNNYFTGPILVNEGNVNTGIIWQSTAANNDFYLTMNDGVTPITDNSTDKTNFVNGKIEGTFTPNATFTTPGNLNVSFSYRMGRFVRTRDTVTVWVHMNTNTWTHTTATGSFIITGLPYRLSNTDVNWYVAGSSMRYTGLTFGPGQNYLCPIANPDTTNVVIVISEANTSGPQIGVTNMPTTTNWNMLFSLTYRPAK